MARRNRMPAGMFTKGLAALALAAAGCASTAPPAPVAVSPLGVKVEGLRLSAAGYMLDLRYRVVDLEKARPLFERSARPLLTDEGTGTQLAVPTAPKLGQLRTTNARNAKADRSYSMLFANPGRVVQPGTKMALRIGGARIDGLVVE